MTSYITCAPNSARRNTPQYAKVIQDASSKWGGGYMFGNNHWPTLRPWLYDVWSESCQSSIETLHWLLLQESFPHPHSETVLTCKQHAKPVRDPCQSIRNFGPPRRIGSIAPAEELWCTMVYSKVVSGLMNLQFLMVNINPFLVILGVVYSWVYHIAWLELSWTQKRWASWPTFSGDKCGCAHLPRIAAQLLLCPAVCSLPRFRRWPRA
jgi:hypothetical protein